MRPGALALASVTLVAAGCGGADGQAGGGGGDQESAYCVDENGEVVDDSKCGDDVGSALGGG